VENILEYENWLSESLQWAQGGWIFIKGKPLKEKDGKSYVFLMSAKYVSELPRFKSNSNPGSPVYMVNLYPEVHVLGYENGVLSAKKINPTPEDMKNYVGMSGFNIGLNKNKTPGWRSTIGTKNMRDVIKYGEYWLPKETWAILPKL